MLTYQKLFNNPGKLLRFTGLNPIQFETLAKRLEPLWFKAETKRLERDSRVRRVGAGRQYRLKTIEEKLFLILVFYRTGVIYEFLGWVFDLDSSNVCRLIGRLSPLMEEAADPILAFAIKDILKKRKKIKTWEEFVKKYPDLFELVIDTTEQKRKRPTHKKKQKNYYSGKKHIHSFKTQITVNRQGRIINVSRTYSGRIHDKTILIKEKTLDRLPCDLKKYLDKGYVKIQKLYPNHVVFIPTKRNRWKRTLTRSEKIKNTKISKRRIIVENVFSRMKKYSLLSQTYRLKDESYNCNFRNIAALCNFRLLFKKLNSS